jgi:hypothetical protein
MNTADAAFDLGVFRTSRHNGWVRAGMAQATSHNVHPRHLRLSAPAFISHHLRPHLSGGHRQLRHQSAASLRKAPERNQ